MSTTEAIIRTLSFPVIISLTLVACSQQKKGEADLPADMQNHEFLEYSGGQAIFDPEDVIRADSNWKILLACLTPKTRVELRQSGISFAESQLMLLRAMGLIRIDDGKDQSGVIKTVMPILGARAKQMLDRELRGLARSVTTEIEGDLRLLRGALNQAGYEERLFTIFFSFVADGLVWIPLRTQGVVSEFKLTPEKPLYDGVFWGYYPKRAFRCGTNIALGNDLYVLLTWSDGPRGKIQAIFNWPNLRRIHKDLAEHGRITDVQLLRALEPYGIVNNSGVLTVPIIELKGTDLIFLVCQKMALSIVRLVTQKMDTDRLCREYGFSDKEKAFVVAYHEWMWELMEELVDRGLVKKPLAFAKPEEAGPREIGQLLFVAKGSINPPK